MKTGGYENGYKASKCFWGKKPGSLILLLEEYIDNFEGKRVIDLGCGEGKNSYFLGEKGSIVDGYEMSALAIENGQKIFGHYKNVKIHQRNVLTVDIEKNIYDIVICYGLFHCLSTLDEVEGLIQTCLDGLIEGGFFVICAFNSRKQDLSAHEDFNPILLDHKKYLDLVQNYKIIFESDTDLYETHPHNNIPHMHSMTRIIVKKI